MDALTARESVRQLRFFAVPALYERRIDWNVKTGQPQTAATAVTQTLKDFAAELQAGGVFLPTAYVTAATALLIGKAGPSVFDYAEVIVALSQSLSRVFPSFASSSGTSVRSFTWMP